MKKYILLLFIIHSALFIHAQKKVYVRMIDTSGWGNNFADTASINALSLSLYDRLADTSAAVRSALVDTASAIRGALPALEESQAIIDTASAIRSTIAALPSDNIYTADGTISDAVRNVTLGSNDINFDANTLFIDGSADRVGMGTASPSELLDILNSGSAKYRLSNSTTNYTEFRQNPTQLRINGLSQTGVSSIDINPIASDGSGQQYFRFFRESNSTGNTYFAVYKGDNTSTINALIGGNGVNTYFAANNGNVGIGTTGPSVMLDVNGQIRARTWTGASTTTVCRDANGVLVPCTSDARLKRNISPIDSTQALDKVLDLVPVTYRWKPENIRDDIDTVAIQSAKAIIDSLKMIEASDTTGEVRQQIKDQRDILRQARKDIKDRRDAVTRYNYGFIAQQVRGVDEILSGETDDGYLTVHNDQITSLLVGAIKAQEAKIKSQEMIIADLIARVESLENND